MSHRVINAFSLAQRNFETITSGDVYSWGFSGGNGNDTILPRKFSFYDTYISLPSVNVPLSLNSGVVKAVDSSLAVGSDVNDVVFVSPVVSVIPGDVYSFSIAAVPVSSNLTFRFAVEFFEQDAVTLISIDDSSVDIDALQLNVKVWSNYFKIPQGTVSARLKITVTGYKGASLKNYDFCAFFDPVVCNVTPSKISFFSETVYSSIPAFMQVDDEKINDILSASPGGSGSTYQMIYPLRRFIESLCAVADEIYFELDEYRYDRAIDGTEHKSKLTDPDTTDASYLPWLANITGSKLFSISTGFSSWTALESYDGDLDSIPGEWDDIESLETWRAIQNLNPNLFDSTQGYRDQLRTGATGLNAGRPDSIVELIRTLLTSETSATDVVVISNEYTDNPFRVKLLVDPSSDPDPTGSLLINIAGKILSVGSSVVKESQVIDSGRGSYRLQDALYPNTFNTETACGSTIYGQTFISDYEFSGQNIVLNTYNETDSRPELGGGVGSAHFSENSAYYFGWDGSSFSSLTAVNNVTSIGASANYDIVAVLTDVVAPVASVYTDVDTGSLTPPDYLFRDKRLIACGTDGDSLGNDWAIYLASGITPSPDNASRLLFIDGYRTRNLTNYAYSDPIDPSFFSQHKEVCVRFRKEGTNFSFYIQNSLYDDWETNIVGSGSFTPASTSSGSSHGVQILGELITSNDWSNAQPLACAVKRLMIFNDVISFDSESSVSANAHAVCNGGEVLDFGTYLYTPTVDIDISNVDLYADSFQATTYSNFSYGTIEVTVNKASSNDVDILAMRPHPTNGSLWHFGNAGTSATADILHVDLASSASYKWRVNEINPSDGTIIQNDYSGTVDQIDFYSSTYSGKAISSIEVTTAAGTFSASGYTAPSPNIAYYYPGVISASATEGIDNAGASWSLDLAWPSSGVAYSPSQIIDKPCVHMYESTPRVVKGVNSMHSFNFEHWKSFSIFLHIKRVWTGVEGTETDIYEIFNVDYGGGIGLRVYYDGPKIKATYSDGVSIEAVEWVETPTFGEWHRVVVRRNGTTFSMVVDGDTDNESSTDIALSVPFPDTIPEKYFSEGGFSSWTPRFALAHFSFFDRYLSNGEISLLETEI